MEKTLKKFFSFFMETEESKNEEKKSIREYLPEGFLNFALYHIICNNSYYRQKNWKVTSCYFVGSTLCLDIENKSRNIEDVITICSDNTFGFFVHYDTYERSKLLQEEIDKVNIIRKNNNVKVNF